MLLITKENISKELLSRYVGAGVVLLETKFGIKKVLLERINRVARGKYKGQSGYIFNRIQGPWLVRSDARTTVLHGAPKEIIKFIKTDDYEIEG